MAELIVLTGPAAERRLEVSAEHRFVIGRDEACNLALDDTKVSRRHAYLQEVDGKVEVGDLGSSNGTFVNGRRIERPVMLAPGDSLRIGDSTMRIDPDADHTARPRRPARSRRAGRRRRESGAWSRATRALSSGCGSSARSETGDVARACSLSSFAAGAIVAAVTGVFSSDPEPRRPTASEIIAG